MIKVNDIFEVTYGTNFEYYNMESDKNGIPFVSRTFQNNGVVGHVTRIEEITPNPKNTISVAVSGSVMASFLQEEEYYSGFHLFCLIPKERLSKQQLLYYCMVLKANKYRYNYGRQANKTLKNILIPSIDEIPSWVNETKIPSKPTREAINENIISLSDREWEWFRYEEIFHIYGGYYNKKPDATLNGDIPFIGATENNNGITSMHDKKIIALTSKDGSQSNHDLSKKIFDENCISISNNGSVGYAFYQPVPFTCSHDVNPVRLKNPLMNPFIAMFLCTLVELERYRWAYGRKWRPTRMPKSLIKLPVNDAGIPDWQFMEDYIKSLPYSKNLLSNEANYISITSQHKNSKKFSLTNHPA